MEVILLEKIKKLGDLGDKVAIKPGYGRNYLIPKGKAVPATKRNLADFEERRAELEKREAEGLAAAQARAEALEALEIQIPVKAGEEGKLFGSIGARDIAGAISAKGVEVARSEVRLPGGPIRQIGEYQVDLSLHTDVAVTVDLVVIPE